MVDTGLAGRTVLVTGGTGDIGAAISRAFAREGARVVVHYLAEQAGAPDGVCWEHALPGGAPALAEELGGVAVSADLAAPGAAARLFDAAGPVDALVDIADAVVFLASHQARWITGQVLQVAGGHAP